MEAKIDIKEEDLTEDEFKRKPFPEQNWIIYKILNGNFGKLKGESDGK